MTKLKLIEKSKRQKNRYLAFNKPIGIVCTTDRKVEPNNVIDFIKYPKRIFPIGRLDNYLFSADKKNNPKWPLE